MLRRLCFAALRQVGRVRQVRLHCRVHCRTAAVILAALAAVLGFAPPASAQFFFFDQFKPRHYYAPPRHLQPRVQHHRPTEPARPRKSRRADPPPVDPSDSATDSAAAAPITAPAAAPAAAPPPPALAKTARKAGIPADDPNRPLVAVISIEDQHVSVYGANGLIERSDVSTGKPDHPTPTGVFAVIAKERWHASNLYSGAPMPFMQRITWSGVAMHQGQLPGYAASHGCIRLRGEFAERWFKMTKIGLRVIIAPSDIEPVPFASSRLPVPRSWPMPAESAALMRQPVQSAALSVDELAELAAPAAGLNPVTYAALEKIKAKADLKASEQAEGEAGDALAAANLGLKEAQKALKPAERAFAEAEDRAKWFGLIGNDPPPPPRADFRDGLLAARDAYGQARSDLAAAQRALQAAEQKVADATAADQAADARTEALKTRITEMGRRQETVSVFISRKEGRLYVRQALRPVFDVPVVFKDPEEPVGTHVFIAAAPAPGEKALRWTALTTPIEGVVQSKSRRGRKSGGEEDGDTPSIASAILTESPAGALGRVEIPGEVMDRLSELVWAGSSIIVSDHGLSNETGLGTDFIIETKR